METVRACWWCGGGKHRRPNSPKMEFEVDPPEVPARWSMFVSLLGGCPHRWPLHPMETSCPDRATDGNEGRGGPIPITAYHNPYTYLYLSQSLDYHPLIPTRQLGGIKGVRHRAELGPVLPVPGPWLVTWQSGFLESRSSPLAVCSSVTYHCQGQPHCCTGPNPAP